MKNYIVKNEEEYYKTLKNIIQNDKTGAITYQKNNNTTAVYFYTILDLPGNIQAIYSKSCSNTQDMINNYGELQRAGTYADGKFYDTNSYLTPFIEPKNFDITTEETAKEIADKITEYITNQLKTTYPDKESILEKFRLPDFSDYDIKNIAREILLNGKTKHEYTISVSKSDYQNMKTAILYNRSKIEKTDNEFIRKKAETLMSKIKDWTKKTNEQKYTEMLYLHYCIQEEIEKTKEKPNPEDMLYQKIKAQITEFLKTKPNAKKVKVFIQGRNEMLTLRAKRLEEYKDFHIEDKEIETNYPIEKFKRYEYNKKFNSYDLEYINPKLKERYSNRIENYLEDFLPSDINRIVYGKTTIYQKK